MIFRLGHGVSSWIILTNANVLCYAYCPVHAQYCSAPFPPPSLRLPSHFFFFTFFLFSCVALVVGVCVFVPVLGCSSCSRLNRPHECLGLVLVPIACSFPSRFCCGLQRRAEQYGVEGRSPGVRSLVPRRRPGVGNAGHGRGRLFVEGSAHSFLRHGAAFTSG